MYSKAVEQILVAMDSADKREGDLPAYQRRMMRLRLLCTVVLLLGYSGTLAYAGVTLWTAWRTGAWSPFWDTVNVLWLTFGLLGIGSAFYEEALHAGQAHVLRERIRMRAQPWQMPEARQSQQLEPNELFAGSGRFGPFERLERGRSLDMVTALILSGLFSMGFVLALMGVLLFARLPTPADVAFVTLVLGLPGAGFTWLTVFVVRRIRRIRRPFWVASGEWGLGWETVSGRRRQARLPWDEVRAFFVITEPDASNDAYSVFVVQGSTVRLAWVMPRAPSPEQRAASDALRRLITARTGLPLTEVSAAILSPEDYDAMPAIPTPAAPQVSPRVARFLTLAWLVPLALTLLLTLSGLLLQHM
jgi:hypothetical protein